MAVAPLFLASMTDLQARLRLSGVTTGDGADPLIDAATRTVRTHFYARLGTSRVSQIQAFPQVDNPTTEEQILRAIADEAEAKWVWLELTRTLPMKFGDNSGDDLDAYNQEGIFRLIPPDQLFRERDQCKIQLEEWLNLLAGDVTIGDVSGPKVFVSGTIKGGRLFPAGTLVGRNEPLWAQEPSKVNPTSGDLPE